MHIALELFFSLRDFEIGIRLGIPQKLICEKIIINQ
jgi:hypothetical protein